MVLRHEGACGRGCRDQVDPLGSGDRSQRPRWSGDTELLHGEETDVWGDQAYQSKTEIVRQRAPKATDRTTQRCKSKLRVKLEVQQENRIKLKTRSRVEHVFALIKLKFGFTKVRFRGLAKNFNQLLVTCALVNLVTARNHLPCQNRSSTIRVQKTNPRHRLPINPARMRFQTILN